MCYDFLLFTHVLEDVPFSKGIVHHPSGEYDVGGVIYNYPPKSPYSRIYK